MSAAAAVHSPPMPKPPAQNRNTASWATGCENAQAALASEYTRIETIKGPRAADAVGDHAEQQPANRGGHQREGIQKAGRARVHGESRMR